ncbi:MAG TPA: lactonase family protein [Candidatus Dormibacteraeota bacterium]|nr:lactonase family protein [Candidatus Dormibacteraeota bacterium]
MHTSRILALPLMALSALQCGPQVQDRRPVAKSDWIMYAGTYTRPPSKGIYAYRFQPASGTFTSIGLVAETANPSFLAIHPNQRFLYAANEISRYEGQSAGSVSAFSIDAASGQLKLLNQVSSKGSGPCHVALDKTGKWLFAANYNGGSVAAFPVHNDGTLGEASAFVQHSGSSVNPQRQREPHAHVATVSPDNRFILVADLGSDQVFVYRLDPAKGRLAPNDPPFVKVAPGSGPRHLAFRPDGRFTYVINEMMSTVTTFGYDAGRGSLQELQTLSTLPEGFTGTNSTAEIAVHPNAKFLYASNRGHDSIAIFQIDPAKGTLTAAGQVATQGKTPRNFAIDPTGAYLLAANQDSASVVVFRIDQKSGGLMPIGTVLEIPFPVCITFVRHTLVASKQ